MTTEDEFRAKGQPIEGAFRSLLAACYPGVELDDREKDILRKMFFAGAASTLNDLWSAVSASEQYDRSAVINREIVAFSDATVAALPTVGNG